MFTFTKSRKLIAVSWDHHELVCMTGERVGTTFRLDEAFCLDFGENSFAEACRVFRDKLKSLGLQSYDLLLALPRSHVDIHTLQLPPASATELPLLVRNELTRLEGELPSDALIDYEVVGEHDPAAPVTVDVSVVPEETNGMIKTLTDTLGRDASRIVVRFQAVASLFARQVKKFPTASLLLNLMQSTADLSLLEGDRIVFTRSIHVLSTEQQQVEATHLADEIRRTLYVAPQQSSPVKHVYMFADLEVDDSLIAQLADELEMTVSLLDPLTGVDLPGPRPTGVHRLAALVGTVRDFVDGATPVDFANPKQPPAPVNKGRKIAFYAVLACAALVTIALVLRREVTDVQAQASTLAADVENNQQLIAKLRQKTAVINAVQSWETSQIDWLNELLRLSQRLPPADRAVIQRLSMAPAGNSQGVISLSVRMRDPAMIGDLEHGLRSPSHQVNSQRISSSGAADDFAVQFQTRVRVAPTAAGQRVESAAARSSSAR